MKIKLIAISILMTALLLSCEKKGDESRQNQSGWPPHQSYTAAETHTVVVQEVTQGTGYTYLKVKENGADFWIAIRKTPMEPGETISYGAPLEMRDFTSKELQRTFDTIYFISAFNKRDASAPAPDLSQMKPTIEKKEISIAPAEDGISIGELFSNKDSYADKTVIIKGQVTKFSAGIMNKNWVHLQDGTSGAGKHDLTITTQDEVAVGDVVTFEGKITLDKDFGAGYKYEVVMEEAKKK